MKSEETIKADIVECFSRYAASAGPDLESERQALFGRLVTLVFKWCTDYPFYVKNRRVDARGMGVELYQTVRACAAQPIGSGAFIPYLKKSLERAWLKYCETSEAPLIRIPKNERARLREIDRILEIANRKLSERESIGIIARWYNISAEKARTYLEMRTKVESLDAAGGEGGVEDGGPSQNISQALVAWFSGDRIDRVREFKPDDDRRIRAAIEAAFAGKQERAKTYIRKLFTLKHIKDFVEFEGESPVVDRTLVDAARRGEKLPAQYEIILEDSDHHFADKASAGVYASKELAKFEKTLREALAEFFY